jgi:hypothetical protein
MKRFDESIHVVGFKNAAFFASVTLRHNITPDMRRRAGWDAAVSHDSERQLIGKLGDGGVRLVVADLGHIACQTKLRLLHVSSPTHPAACH